MDYSKQVIVVTAATGSQGVPIVKYLLAHHSDIYTVRAITRNPSSPIAKSLASLGAHVVRADYSDEPSLRSAFSGAHTIFANTNFWEPTMSFELEVAQGLLIAKVATDEKDLQNFIYSGLGDARGLYDGKYQGNLTYNAKAITLEKIEEDFPSLAAKMIVITIGFYQENWKKYQLVFGPSKIADGSFEMAMPYPSSSRIPLASSEDSGVFVATIIAGGSKFHKKRLSMVTEFLSDEHKLKVWTEELKIKVSFRQVTDSEYQARLEAGGFPPAIAKSTSELTSMVGEGSNYLESPMAGPGVINARDIVDPGYHYKTWAEYVKEEDWSSIL